MDKEYKYDAFISYRHISPDNMVAQSLHVLLEKYVLPKKLRTGNSEERIRRVFRDEEELPSANSLGQVIEDALKESKHLIVICSKEFKNSKWCLREVETFLDMHGSKNIHVVLVDGNVDECLPDVLRGYELNLVDLRAETNRQRKSVLKERYLELVAPVLNVELSDIQREAKEEKNRRIIGVSALVAIISISFGVFSILMGIRINEQRKELARHQAVTLAWSSESALAGDDRLKAIDLAYQSLTKYDGSKMEYTPEGQRALFNAIMPYNTTFPYRASGITRVYSEVSELYTNDSAPAICALQEVGVCNLINIEDKKIKYTHFMSDNTDEDKGGTISVSPEGILRFIDDGTIYTVSGESGSQGDPQKDMYDKFWGVFYGDNETIVPVMKDGEAHIHVISNDEYIPVDYLPYSKVVFASDEATVAYDYKSDDESRGIIIVDINNQKKQIMNIPLEAARFVDADFYDHRLYLLLDAVNELDESYVGIEVFSYNLDTGEEVWNYSSFDTYGKTISIVDTSKRTWLIAACEGSVSIIEPKDDKGDLYKRVALPDRNIGTFEAVDHNGTGIIVADGNEYVFTSYEDGSCEMVPSKIIDVRNPKLKNVFYSSATNTFVATVKGSNEIIYYQNNVGANVEVCTEEPDDTKMIIRAEDYTGMAKMLGLEEYEKVSGIISPESKDIAFVEYQYGKKEIVDTSTGEITASWNSNNHLIAAFGPDRNGYYYLVEKDDDAEFGMKDYVIGSDKKIVGEFDGMFGLSEDGERIILGSSLTDDCYSAPVYNLEELMNLAIEDRKRYE